MRDHTSLYAWQLADGVALEVYKKATDFWSPETAAIWHQLRRAALSTPLNLAEGYRWRPSKRWLFHLRVANGSALETSELLRYLSRLDPRTGEWINQLLDRSVRCERMIWGLIRSERNG